MATVDHSNVVPGTVHLVDVGEQQASAKSKNGIELIPRPSDDPEDPLNWSKGRKYLSMAMVVVYTFGVGMPLTLQYSVLADITADTGISTATLVEGTGYMFLLLGFGCLFWQPIALTYGRRGVYLISTLLTIPLMVWTAYSKNKAEWFLHRILGGFICSPIEALPEVSIPDIFFAHERGAFMGLYVFSLFGSNFLAPLIGGWFAERWGWKWMMHFGAMFAGLAFIILFFFMEETMYFRQTLEGLEDETPVAAAAPVLVNGEKKLSGSDSSDVASQSPAVIYEKRSYVEKLKWFVVVEGRPTLSHMFKSMYTPLIYIFEFPIVAWAGFIYGINLCWYNVLNGTASPVLASAPYSWGSGLVGSIYAGPIVGAAFGCIWAGTVADKLTIWLARRNNGVREPEHRLWPLLLTSLLSCIGLIIWGVGAANHVHWAVLAVGLGILTFGVVAGGSVALSYNIDCYKEISGDTTTSVIIIRNCLGFAISYGITPWYTNMGLQNCFIMAGFLSLGCTLTFLIMVWKGKDLRRLSAKKYWKYAALSSSAH
ncbi:putative transporter [Podospora fimiseda]|uniref:Transporter n=1 Tax=Podospora fimiseda TaxID=252190 RepID=A0AAN7BMC1_9PEZI|nr:putative transporter [Podospora fimiseda]